VAMARRNEGDGKSQIRNRKSQITNHESRIDKCPS
jgi:hypothetical protein